MGIEPNRAPGRWPANPILLALALPLLAALLDRAGDADLAARLRRRDPHAMSLLYDRYGRLCYSVIRRIVRHDDAEDLLQETFLRIWNRIHGFDPGRGALGPWILTVARNRAIDYLRSREGRAADTAIDSERLEHPSLFLDLENHIMNLDRVRSLREAFGRLSPNQRLVIELAYFEGLSQTEMSERLRQPLGTVKTWVRSALKTLREELSEAAVA
jgi:RNA polymerase sigma-70 factor (ECF subfamily)